MDKVTTSYHSYIYSYKAHCPQKGVDTVDLYIHNQMQSKHSLCRGGVSTKIFTFQLLSDNCFLETLGNVTILLLECPAQTPPTRVWCHK